MRGMPTSWFFYELGKRKNVMISGDIGCYTLGFAKSFNAIDSCVCMGAGFSIGHGAQKVFDKAGHGVRVVSVLGGFNILPYGNKFVDYDSVQQE